MRRALGLIALTIGASVVVVLAPAAKGADSSVLVSKAEAAETETEQTGETPPVVAVRTSEEIEVTPEERQRAAIAHQKATVEEQQIQSRLRSLQALMQKEEAALAQRLAYAAKIREQGLSKNDQTLLDKAEQFERQSLDYYQKRVQQFEKASISTESSATPTAASRAASSSRPVPSKGSTTPPRSTSRSRTQR